MIARAEWREIMQRGIAAVMAGILAGSPMFGRAQQPQQSGSDTFTLKVQTDIVLTNVVVRDKKTGEVIKGLKPSDFQVFENGKQQAIATFDYQNVDEAAVLKEQSTVTASGVVTQICAQ